ncbi:MAG: GNAT family N-acetyltransferase [Actinomycetota bacterium]
MPLEWRRGDYAISTDPARLDLGVIHGFLDRESYWAEGVTRDRVARSIERSLPFGLYDASGAQAGFARVVTDFTIFAWLCDVFVLEPHRGLGLGVWLVETVMSHPELQSLRQWLLGTKDAHGLYARFGFEPAEEPGRYLRVRRSEREIAGG